MERIIEMYVKMMSMLKNEKGQGVVEYALLLVLIAIIAILMMKGVGQQSCTAFSKVNSALQ